ncbi:MAG TPA: PilZ domain-containing protein [Terriglobales bacterium]|nr:PilZ domain-containing protein [Terriglobales bacterium]
MSSLAQAALQSLLLCSDDKVVRVLRRVLTDLEVGVEHCTDLDAAVQKLTRQRFEAVIVDCTTKHIASKILKGIKSAPANNRAIAVAIINGQEDLRSAFELGAHFVLIKPIDLDRTKASFRSVRALMKRERRRHARIPVELSVKIHLENAARNLQVVTADLSENGMAIKTKVQLPPSFRVEFELPSKGGLVQCRGELAWEGKPFQGIRFCDVSDEASKHLKAWISRQLLSLDADDPPVNCRLTDLSLNACYLETESPFPVRTRLQIAMKVSDLELQTEGMVRVMHPGTGMGVQFAFKGPDDTSRLEHFIQTLVSTAGAMPAVEVKPDTIDNSPSAFAEQQTGNDNGDSLLGLFRMGAELPPDDFRAELKKQRGAAQAASA